MTVEEMRERAFYAIGVFGTLPVSGAGGAALCDMLYELFNSLADLQEKIERGEKHGS